MNSAYLNLQDLIKEAGLSLPAAPAPPAQAPAQAITNSYAPSQLPVVTVINNPSPPQPKPSQAAQTRKFKFMLVGTHAHQTTGYSKVTYHIIQELSKCKDIEVFHFGFQKFMTQPPEYRPYPPGVDVYDPTEAEKSQGAPKEMGFGFSQLAAYVRKVKPDIMMIYNDAGVICQFLEKLAADLKPEERKYKLIIYLDQVYEIQRPLYLARIEQDADMYFTFTEYWKQVLEKQGVKKPIHVLRHGFDPSQFKPMDRAAARRKHGIPEQLFIFLNLNRNTPRKRHDLVVQAFAHLVARNPTKPLALLEVCDNGEAGGYPIQEIYLRTLDSLNVPIQQHAHKLMISKQSLTYTDELINELYALSDVGITAADGEGFGLCQFEAMGIGIPQVVPHIGGFRDFCTPENSQLVKPKYKSYLSLGSSSIGGIAEIVDPFELSLAAENYIMDSELREKHGVAARKTVLSYEWSKEVQSLIKVLRELAPK
jgi:glycosyltransferase involved in cell wall biosynthesis